MANKKYVLKVNNTEPDEFGNVSVEGGGTTGESYIEITKSQLDTHITNSTLKPGVLYEISGVDVPLYGGTDIYLKAVTINSLESSGTGKFYNPKYNPELDNKGIWDNFIRLLVTDTLYPNGQIDIDTVVTANNGATAKFKSVTLLVYLSGDWSTATSYTVKGITFDITSVQNIPTYNVDDVVIWGGRHWRNLNGNFGDVPTDDFNLDANEWELIIFNQNDYNVVYDDIKYDYENDLIIYRKDLNNNEVETCKADFDYFMSDWGVVINAIKLFQWGREFTESTGVGNNKVLNRSSIMQLNSFGHIYSNTMNNCYIASNTMENGSQINYNTMNNSQINYNTMNNSQINYNTMNNSQINYNTMENSSWINNNTMENNSRIYSNTMNNSRIYTNTMNDSRIYTNTMNNGYITSNTMNNSYITSNKLNDSHIYSITMKNDGYIRLGLANIITNKNFGKLNIFSGDIGGDTGIDLSSATLVYAEFTREVFKDSTGATKIRYVDGSGTTIIANVTD